MKYRNIEINPDGTYNIVWFKSKGISEGNKIESENYVDGSEGIAKSLVQHLSVIKNELWYNTDYGLPLCDKIKNKAVIDASIINIIERHIEVKSILTYKSYVDKNVYYFDSKILSIYGDEINLSSQYEI